jgi:hypothetical protein
MGGRMLFSRRRDAVYDDPMLSRMFMLHELPTEQQLSWISVASSKLVNAKGRLKDSSVEGSVGFEAMLLEAELAMIDLRLEWLGRLYDQIVTEACGAKDGKTP